MPGMSGLTSSSKCKKSERIDTTIVGRPGVRMGEAARFLRRTLVDSLVSTGAGIP